MKFVEILLCFLVLNVYVQIGSYSNRKLKKVNFSEKFVKNRLKQNRQGIKKHHKKLKLLPQTYNSKKDKKTQFQTRRFQKQQQSDTIYNNFKKTQKILEKIDKKKQSQAIKNLSQNDLEIILKQTLKKKKKLDKKLQQIKPKKQITIKNSPFIKYMERKLEEEQTVYSKTIDTAEIDQQIKETYVLKNLDLDKPSFNYDYLNEEIKLQNFTNIQVEDYDAQLSFEQLIKINKKLVKCQHSAKNMLSNLILIFDTSEVFQKCNLYIAEAITIMTNIYIFIIQKIGQLLPNHIIHNQIDYNQSRYISMLMSLDFPNIDLISEYVTYSDGKTLKKLIRDTPKEVYDFKSFFAEQRNFFDLKNLLKKLNLTEGRKLIIYFSNAIKYYQFVCNYYNQKLHNKGGDGKGSFYTNDIPKLIEVNDDLSSEEQKVFLQEDKEMVNLSEDKEKEQLKDSLKFHVKDSPALQKVLDQYLEQVDQRQMEHKVRNQQDAIQQYVQFDLEKFKKNKPATQDPQLLNLGEIYNQQEQIENSGMDMFSVLPLNIPAYVNKNKKERLSKREKKELKKQQRIKKKQQKQAEVKKWLESKNQVNKNNQNTQQKSNTQNENNQSQNNNNFQQQILQPTPNDLNEDKNKNQIQNDIQKNEDMNTAKNDFNSLNRILQLN